MTEKDLEKLIDRVIDADSSALEILTSLSDAERKALIEFLHVRNAAMAEESQLWRKQLEEVDAMLVASGFDPQREMAAANKGKIGFPLSPSNHTSSIKQSLWIMSARCLADMPAMTHLQNRSAGRKAA